MRRRVVFWSLVSIVVVVLVLFGLWWDFIQMSSAVIGWLRSDSKLYEGVLLDC